MFISNWLRTFKRSTAPLSGRPRNVAPKIAGIAATTLLLTVSMVPASMAVDSPQSGADRPQSGEKPIPTESPLPEVTDPGLGDSEHPLDQPTSGQSSESLQKGAATNSLITPMSLPVPEGNEAVITVKVGGVRTTQTDVAGLAGVTLKLYNGGSSGPDANPRSEPWATCISDADGDCSFVVPNTQPGGANYDARFWIKQVLPPPSGYFMNSTLATGTSPTSSTYQFRTGSQLRQSVTYSSTQEFMIASGSTNNIASGGIWQSSMTNPATLQQCGLDVALILDISGSVAPFIDDLKGAAKSFVDSLTGTPSSVSLYTFGTNAPAGGGANLGVTPVSTVAGANIVKAQIDTYTAGGGTNWDRGLYQVANSSAVPDVAVVITDGNPTYYANAEGPGNRTRFREVENGIFSANAIKERGTRVVAVGVGEGINGSPDNLSAISGPVANSDYYQTSNYEIAGNVLRELALGNCEGSVTVVKQLVSSTGTGEDISGATPAGGWEFTVEPAATGIAPDTQSDETAVGTGAVNFPLEFAGGTYTGTVNISETQQPGHTLVTQDGLRAVCTDVETGDPVTVQNDPDSETGFLVDVSSTAATSCTVYNRPPQALSSISVDKRWVINGTTYTQGNQPLGIAAQLTLNSTGQNWSSPRTGLAVGTEITINESTSFVGRDLCEITSSRVTAHNGSPVDFALPYDVTISSGDNRYTITNTVNCTAELTLVKQVQGGSAPATSWTLGSVGPDNAIQGPTGVSGTPEATGPITPDARYVLTETGGSGLYVQSIITGGVPTPPAVGSWSCVQVNANGTVIPGFADGINGGITAPLGYRIRCTAINQTSSLTLIKQVVNDNGQTKIPADWTLTATPTGTVPEDVVAQSVAGSTNGTTINVRPSTTYNLTEAGPSGYELASLQCDTGPNHTYVDVTSISVDPLEHVTCIFVNDDLGATLTLVKTVDNGDTGYENPPSAWTLAADGPTPIEGASGSTEVTNAVVSVGDYTLSEEGPAGYTASDWTCTDGTLTGSVLTLASGDNAICTINNTAQPSIWTYSKSSNPPTGSVVMPGQTITYTIELEHQGGLAPRNVVLLDDLSDVLDDAELVGEPTVSVGEAELDGQDLVWTVGTFTGTQTLTYQILINEDAYGASLRNLVTSRTRNPCVTVCETEHGTPAWELWKSSDPASGTTVPRGGSITYTLHARNTSSATMSGAVVTDDLTEVLTGATLKTPLPAGLTFDSTTKLLTWAVPDLAPEADALTVSYQVDVSASAGGTTLENVATPGPGGQCREPDDCDTTHRVPDIDLAIAKIHSPIPEGAVDINRDETVAYTVTVTNEKDDAAVNPQVKDTLPPGLTYVPDTLVLPDGWTGSFNGRVLTASYEGDFVPGATAEFTYSTLVGEPPRAGPADSYGDLVNTACVETESDDNPNNDCATSIVKVKSVQVEASAVCRADTPWASYQITPVNLEGTPPIALIWWTEEAFANRDPDIPASDTAALLADGASQVDPIEVPAGWEPGDAISGEKLWPGAAIDAEGNPIAWPGWTELPDGTWILDPEAPFYELRGAAVLEVRINPSTAETLVYPPATPNCNAQPPVVVSTPTPTPTPTGTSPSMPPGLPETGAGWTSAIAMLAVALLALGGLALFAAQRNRRDES